MIKLHIIQDRLRILDFIFFLLNMPSTVLCSVASAEFECVLDGRPNVLSFFVSFIIFYTKISEIKIPYV